MVKLLKLKIVCNEPFVGYTQPTGAIWLSLNFMARVPNIYIQVYIVMEEDNQDGK
jgi:hypothetical protein